MARGANKGFYISHVNEINKEIERGLKKNRVKAAQFVVKKLKQEVGNVADEGDYSKAGSPPNKYRGHLQKGITYKNLNYAVLVGFQDPAYHAHLMEFGTDPRFQTTTTTKKSGKIKLKKLRYVGQVRKRPFFVKTLLANKEEIKRLTSEPVL